MDSVSITPRQLVEVGTTLKSIRRPRNCSCSVGGTSDRDVPILHLGISVRVGLRARGIHTCYPPASQHSNR